MISSHDFHFLTSCSLWHHGNLFWQVHQWFSYCRIQRSFLGLPLSLCHVKTAFLKCFSSSVSFQLCFYALPWNSPIAFYSLLLPLPHSWCQSALGLGSRLSHSLSKGAYLVSWFYSPWFPRVYLLAKTSLLNFRHKCKWSSSIHIGYLSVISELNLYFSS